ncbi:MAG: hypothetical protein A2075_12000 [Geobacteraceae bacterium GWC2_58_44]|nr:MAG: hypothetical protein A2075_12000 [Geobacteraceae bacterium GWC2_58_44]HBG06285.1 hypothetical protein [Geobacter sp.]
MYFYTEPGGDAIAKAFHKCGALMKEGKHLQTAIVVPQMSNLNGIISDYLGDDAIRCLTKNKVIKLNPEEILLFTKRNPPLMFKGPILAAFTTIPQVKAIIKACPGAEIVYIPWQEDEKDLYVKLYRATQL